eukprot:scaffold103534_cov74-Phaeocystis_antarctica.AAC.4
MTLRRPRRSRPATRCPGRRSGSTPPPPQPVHVVVEYHGADALANGGARGAVVGEREEFALTSTARLGVEVEPRPVNTCRGAGVTGWRPVVCLCEGIFWVAAAIRPAGACGAAEVKGCGRLRRWRPWRFTKRRRSRRAAQH